jgi:beta-phosphoglucomutase-like phosphatase (HAD superfamily)
MESIKAVLLEPVGCLAEFAPRAFNSAAADLFGVRPDAEASGSQAYWRLMGLMDERPLSGADLARLAELEVAAVEHADLYEDALPALAELKSLGVATVLASSLSRAAVTRFIERHALADLLAAAVTRDEAGGVMGKVLSAVIQTAQFVPSHVMALADTAQGLAIAQQLGLNAMLMINDYDEGRALAERNPAGGIVSLAELPDALRLIEQRSGIRATARAPHAPFELFDPT